MILLAALFILLILIYYNRDTRDLFTMVKAIDPILPFDNDCQDYGDIDDIDLDEVVKTARPKIILY